MKKFFTLIAAVMLSLNVLAAKYSIGVPTNNAEGVFDAATKTITFDAADSYKPGWWMGWNDADKANTGQDYSKYDDFVVELEPTDYDVTLCFEYIDENIPNGVVTSKDGKLVVKLDANGKAHVKQAYLKVGEDGVGKSVVFKDAYFQNAEAEATSAVIFDTPATTPLDWADAKVSANLTDDAKVLLQEGNILRIEYKNYPYENEDDKYYQVQVMGSWWTILSATASMKNADVKTKADGSYENVILNLDDSGVIDITLNAQDVNTLKEQGALLLAGHGILVQKISILKGDATGISNAVVAPKANANAPIFNLAGQKVSKAYKGVVIQNGKKFVQK